MNRTEQASVTAQIADLQRMTVRELQEQWKNLYAGEETRSCNKQYLFRRLCWRIQELQFGGLSERAKTRISELNRDDDLRFLPPRGWNPSTIAAPAPTSSRCGHAVRDPRLPSPGSVITRQYHGQEIRVTVLEKGFEWEGCPYRSLSAVARDVCGQRWNGFLFFQLATRRRKA